MVQYAVLIYSGTPAGGTDAEPDDLQAHEIEREFLTRCLAGLKSAPASAG